ncbi:hypothetical protein E8K88_14730 [Lampropedia aestuarii]|uniref:DUF1795 domain-containing protein n=1 Tax=Lampropedia aestuarii TaxID=2562762 RepID=A0A4S5BGT3_9BURK|nr:hypothetical protein [Lampropedia aestuarii]THJ31567.1 hypothetical protein E8K88_14730 [Lampropedia aestuarii]
MKIKIHQIFKQTCVSLLFFTFTGATYAQCSAPKFEPLRYAQDSVNTDSWISLSVGPSLASLSIPSGFTSISITEEGSLIFSKDEKTELRGIIIFEKTGDYQEDPNIAENIQSFYKKMFTAPDDSYCDYLTTYKLESKEYRFHAQIDGGEFFAFGENNQHRFYILINKKPDVIIAGNIQNIDLKYFKYILNSIKIKG